MGIRYLLIGSATLAIAGATVAAPVKPQAPQPQVRPPEVVLASAEHVRTPDANEPQQGSPTVKRPRAARVTSCRCAGQASPPQQTDQ